jgi:hypothetical protein
MARELVWLENSTFAAWGCIGCNWIMENVDATSSGKPSLRVKISFNEHECSKFPQKKSAGKVEWE